MDQEAIILFLTIALIIGGTFMLNFIVWLFLQ